MKKLAARDFEDILQVRLCLLKIHCRQSAERLQCFIPVIEGLLPSQKDEDEILDLIFILATWHAYAKLRLHTDNTLASFDALTKPLGAALRNFGGKLSDRFDTRELPKEADARKRREAARETQGKTSNKREGRATRVKFNLSTYKLHALGDYANTIRRRGTTDSYSTQTVCIFLINNTVYSNDIARESASIEESSASTPVRITDSSPNPSAIRRRVNVSFEDS